MCTCWTVSGDSSLLVVLVVVEQVSAAPNSTSRNGIHMAVLLRKLVDNAIRYSPAHPAVEVAVTKAAPGCPACRRA